jgi:ElaB/YqjD/DUF883 family membrane-anchored ribosome-binding protein
MANTSNQGKAGTEQWREQQPQTGTREAACSTTEGHQGQAEDLSSTITRKASEAWETTREGVQSAASSVASAAESSWDEVSSFVRRHPWACLACGCGIGYLAIRAMGGEDRVAGGMSRSWRRYQEDHPSSRWRGEEPGPRQNQGLTSTMTQRAGEAWESAKQGAQDMASSVASRTNQAMDTLGDWSREYPRGTPATGLLVGLCTGFAAGWLLGCQTSRSR